MCCGNDTKHQISYELPNLAHFISSKLFYMLRPISHWLVEGKNSFPGNFLLLSEIVSYWTKMWVYCQFLAKMLQNTWKAKINCMWFILKWKTVLGSICPVRHVWSFPSNLSLFLRSPLFPGFVRYATKTIQNTNTAINFQYCSFWSSKLFWTG